jgi:adenine-specific DNA methylase
MTLKQLLGFSYFINNKLIIMTPKEYSKKKYPMAINYQIIAEEAYADGLKANPEMKEINWFKNELEKCRKELKEANAILHDNERLADWVVNG